MIMMISYPSAFCVSSNFVLRQSLCLNFDLYWNNSLFHETKFLFRNKFLFDETKFSIRNKNLFHEHLSMNESLKFISIHQKFQAF